MTFRESPRLNSRDSLYFNIHDVMKTPVVAKILHEVLVLHGILSPPTVFITSFRLKNKTFILNKGKCFSSMHIVICLTHGVAQNQLCLIGESYMASGIFILLHSNCTAVGRASGSMMPPT